MVCTTRKVRSTTRRGTPGTLVDVPVAFLVLAVLGTLGLFNAVRPLRWTPLVLPAFFAAWLTAELAPQLVVLLVVGTAAFALLGGLSGLPGVLALALCVLQLVLLLRLIAESERAAAVADAALAELPDADDEGRGSDVEATSGLRRFFVPLSFRHPDVERIVDVPYSDLSPRHRLDVYRHREHPAGCPTLLQVHGGGWVIGDKREQGRPLMLHLASAGWVCFTPNYRLSPRATFPDHLVDIKRAIAWVREHGPEYGADPGFLVLTGGSAGGHLAALAALTHDDPQYQPGFEDADTAVQACVPYYGVYDLAGETATRAAKVRAERLLAPLVFKSANRSLYQAASPLSHVRADAPPFLVIHGRNDTLVPVEEARLFVERLRAVSRAPVAYVELPGTQHAFDVFPSIRSAHIVRAVGRFVEAVRRRHAASA
jgi:acetyl esterase/lipase